ncbi:MAG: hypothetical protein M1122_00600 [Candidatus Marsarchaeota archaeon]|jgi:hypothetical protein|nr:hypothetical protein [Candidatus Marsarchaeota archaeon]
MIHDDMPAWLVMEDILIRVKEGLLSVALETLQTEIDAKRVQINGHLIKTPESLDDKETNLFIISNIVSREGEIIEMYEHEKKKLESGNVSPEIAYGIDELRKFAMAAVQLSVLMNYVEITNRWMNDVKEDTKKENVERLIIDSIKSDRERRNLIEFISKSKALVDIGSVSAQEREMMAGVIKNFPEGESGQKL